MPRGQRWIHRLEETFCNLAGLLVLLLPAIPDRLYSVPVKPLSIEIWHSVCGFFSLVCTERVEEELGPNLPAVWLDRCGMALNPRWPIVLMRKLPGNQASWQMSQDACGFSGTGWSYITFSGRISQRPHSQVSVYCIQGLILWVASSSPDRGSS